jgi:Flp pilus assembly protein TadB
MENPLTVSWVPAGLFALLGLYFLQKALRPKARQSWGWGRTGGKVPLSRASYGVCGLAFLNIAALIARAPRPPLWLAALFMVLLLAILVMGFLDTRAYRRTRKNGETDLN